MTIPRLFALVALASVAWIDAASARPPSSTSSRWAEPTADAMIENALVRARKGGGEALASMALVHALAEEGSLGLAKAGFDGLSTMPGELGSTAKWLGAQIDPENSAPSGLVRELAILGPFPDNGGGILRKEGPELSGFDPSVRHDLGSYEVRWRELPKHLVTARGLPLDLLVHPRTESCTYLASRLEVKDASPFVVQVAGTGSLRLFWNGRDVATSEEVHEKLVFDRLAARIDPVPGEHVLGVKLCSGALADEGRVRIRIEDPSGRPLALPASPNLAGIAPPNDASKLVAIETPLAKALSLGPRASEKDAFHAAISRTLGGAEDQGSPRAPGLFDRVTQSKKTEPNLLALAGWASPFGASRSQWLNLAKERARKNRDEATESFALRKLAESRLRAGLVDFAMAALEEEPLASATDADARLLRARVKARLGLASLRRMALDEALALVREREGRASIATWEKVAELAAGFDRGLEAEARERLASMHPSRRDAAYVRAMATRDAEALRKAAGAVLSGPLASAEELFAIADTLTGAGLYPEAKAAWEKATFLAPNHARASSGLAEALYREGHIARADEAMKRARELQPADSTIRAALSFRAEARGEKVIAEDEKYLVDPSEFLSRKARSPAAIGKVFARDLHWLRAVRLHPDRRVSQLIHYAREIVIEPRTSFELEEMLPPEGDQIEILRARVHRKAGGIGFAEEQHAEGSRAYVRWPELRTGDVIEVAMRTFTKGPVGRRGDAPFYFVDYAGALETQPLLYNEVIIDSPVDAPLAFDVLHGKPDTLLDEVREGRRIQRIVFEKPPIFRDEPLAPRPSEFLPTIVASTFASFREFRAWYEDAASGFTEPDEEIRRLASELVRGKTSREEKLRALFDFVADDIRYVNYVSGEAWLPNRPQQLLARRQGDCDDKAILLIALMKAVGIEGAKLALVQTRHTGQPSILLSEKAALPLFDHGVAYLPGENGAPALWLDATSPKSRIGPLPSMNARALSFFIGEGPAEMVKTPKSRPEDHGVLGVWKVELLPSGDALLRADEQHLGDHAFFLRTSLEEKDARAAFIEQNLLAGWLPTVRIGEGIDFQGDREGGRARLRYTARSLGFARREGEDLVVPLARISTYASELAPLAERSLPIVLPAHLSPSQETRTIHIQAPEGFGIAELPKGGVVDGGEFGRAELEIVRDPKSPREVVVKRSLGFDASTIPASAYPAWRAWLGEVDALFRRSLRMSPEKKLPATKAIARGGKR